MLTQIKNNKVDKISGEKIKKKSYSHYNFIDTLDKRINQPDSKQVELKTKLFFLFFLLDRLRVGLLTILKPEK